MINTTPDGEAEGIQVLEFDETIEGAECDEAKKLTALKEGMGILIEISSDEEAMEEEESKMANLTMLRLHK